MSQTSNQQNNETVSGSNIRIWDNPTILVNWLLLLSFVFAYITVSAPTYGFFLHIVFISALFVGLVFRTFWGVFGARTARFSEMLTSPAAMLSQLNDLINFRREIWVGHSPLSGFFSVIFLLLLWTCVVSGLFSVASTGEQTWLVQKLFSNALFGESFGTQAFHHTIMNVTALYGAVYAVTTAIFTLFDGGGLRNYLFRGQIHVTQIIHPSRVPLQPRSAGVGIIAAGLICALSAVVFIPSIQDLRSQFRPDEVAPRVATMPDPAQMSAEDLAAIAPAAGSPTDRITSPEVTIGGNEDFIQFGVDPETGELLLR